MKKFLKDAGEVFSLVRKSIHTWYSKMPLSVRIISIFFRKKKMVKGKPNRLLLTKIEKFNFSKDLTIALPIGHVFEETIRENYSISKYGWVHLGKFYFKQIYIYRVQ